MTKNNVAKKCRADNYNRNIYKRNIEVKKKKKKESIILKTLQLLLKTRFSQNVNYKITFDKITCQFFLSLLS